MSSLGRTLRALPTLFRVGFASAVAYRAEMLIWVLTTTAPLIMLPLWHAVGEEAPVAGFTQGRFTAYFLAAFVVRQLIGAWASWTINYEVKNGSLSRRLLRPIHPFVSYAVENLAAIPTRLIVALPVALLALWLTGGEHVLRDPLLWAVVPLALAGAWLITFFAHVAVGSLSLFMHSSIKVMDVWIAGFYVLGGYLVPIDVFPAWLRPIPRHLPFVFQLGYPVDLLTGALGREQALGMLAEQWAFVALLAGLALFIWRRGMRRYGAFGG